MKHPQDITISTLNCPNLIPVRQSGNTYRQVDYAVGKIFEGYIVVCEDHYSLYKDESQRLNEKLFELIVKRMRNEHPYTKIDAHRGNLTIQLSKI